MLEHKQKIFQTNIIDVSRSGQKAVSSSSMVADIVVEYCCNNISIHYVKYAKVIYKFRSEIFVELILVLAMHHFPDNRLILMKTKYWYQLKLISITQFKRWNNTFKGTTQRHQDDWINLDWLARPIGGCHMN